MGPGVKLVAPVTLVELLGGRVVAVIGLDVEFVAITVVELLDGCIVVLVGDETFILLNVLKLLGTRVVTVVGPDVEPVVALTVVELLCG